MEKYVYCPSNTCGMTRLRSYKCNKPGSVEFDELINHVETLGFTLINPEWEIEFAYHELVHPISSKN